MSFFLTPRTCITVVIVGILAAMGADWPEFRGPTGQGIYSGPPLVKEWGPERHVTWKQPVPGKGWSSPIVFQSQLYLTSAVTGSGNDQSLQVMAFDTVTGKSVWNTEVFVQDGKTAPRVHSKNSHASPTPITDGSRVYAHFGHQGTAALSLDGKIIWKSSEHRYNPVHGNGGSPILVDDMLVFSVDGSDKQYLVALDTSTGKTRWKTDRQSQASKKFSFGTPLLIDVNGKRQLVSQASDMVCGVEPKTGVLLWKVPYTGYSVVPRPVFGHGLIFVATGYDSPTLIAVRPDNGSDAKLERVAWTMKRGAPLTPSPILDGDQLYTVSDNGIASCLDAKTGKVHWQERVPGAYSASPILAGKLVYLTNEAGRTTVVRASSKFEVVATNDLKELTYSSIAAVNGVVYIRTEKNLYRIEPKQPAP